MNVYLTKQAASTVHENLAPFGIKDYQIKISTLTMYLLKRPKSTRLAMLVAGEDGGSSVPPVRGRNAKCTTWNTGFQSLLFFLPYFLGTRLCNKP